MANNKAFVRLNADMNRSRVICFPYLGGHAYSYRDLSATIRERYEIFAANPPGHGGMPNGMLEDIHSFVNFFLYSITDIIDRDYILFGHSMGGIVAFFLAHRILKSPLLNKPHAIILSASAMPKKYLTIKHSELSDKDLIENITSFGAMPQDILKDKKFLEFLLPVFRADYKVLESSALADMGKLDLPAYLLWGEKDTIEPFESVAGWQDYFSRDLNMIEVKNGMHMFIHEEVETVAQHIIKIFEENR